MAENSVRLKLRDKGKIAIPVSIREKVGLQTGDTLTMTLLQNGQIQVSSLKKTLSNLAGKYAGSHVSAAGGAS
jgi:AbrB family looped-hinge helix DNA binding protein